MIDLLYVPLIESIWSSMHCFAVEIHHCRLANSSPVSLVILHCAIHEKATILVSTHVCTMDVCTLYISPVAVAVKLHFLRLSVDSTVFSPSAKTGGELDINNLPCVYLFCRYFVIIYYCE